MTFPRKRPRNSSLLSVCKNYGGICRSYSRTPELCGCVCVVISFILDVTLVDVPGGISQEESYTRFLHLPSAVLALIFLARRFQPFLSLVDREVEFCVLTK